MRGAKWHAPDSEAAGEDSFLDVVANVVGVLIILVMVVGLQASQALAPAARQQAPRAEELSQLQAELDTASREASKSRRAIQEQADRAVAIRREVVAQDQARVQLAMHRTVIEQDIQERRAQLDRDRQHEFDVQRQLVETRLQLEELTQAQLAHEPNPAVEEVECVPTPLAKTIDGPAVHLRLRQGLVSIVPFRQLQEQVEQNLASIRHRLQGRDGVVEIYGPIEGYRLRFVVQKTNQARGVNGPLVGQMQRRGVEYLGEFLPNSVNMGQDVEQALLPGSALHALLQQHRRLRTPVVVWLYTDSFDAFRLLKRSLWEMGFAVATRPLEPGAKIKASSRGTKASAQ